MSEPDPLKILGALESHRVRFVLIGAAAARIAGAPVVTEDIDITPATDKANLERLAAALKGLRARLRSPSDTSGVTFPLDADMLRKTDLWTLTTSAGDLDICFTPSGTRGYRDLRREALRIRVGPGITVSVASLRDVIRSKEAANRPKDQLALPALRLLLQRVKAGGGDR